MMHHDPLASTAAAASTQQQMPTTVRWIPDAEVSLCFGCQLLFDWVRRKHHCRYCGHVFCELCTSHRSLIRADQILSNPERQYLSVNGHNPQRVCDPCYNVLLPVQAELRETMSNAVQENEIEEAGPKRFLNSPYSFTLREEIRKAAYSVKNFMYQGVIKDQSIPLPLITQAKGIAFLTVIKVGFVFTGRVGTGLVVARLPDGRWSAPSAIATAGVGWGAQIGGEITDFVIILNTKRAVDAFCSKGQVNLGAELGVCAGPVGRVASGAVEASSDLAIAPCYSYSHSKGLFVGISLEGSMILARSDINRAFYGRNVQVAELLGGMETPPVAAAPLYEAIELAMSSPANGLNRSSRVSEAPPSHAAHATPVTGNGYSNDPVKL
ncbi:Sh3 domain-containing protein [Globisporangium polare]